MWYKKINSQTQGIFNVSLSIREIFSSWCYEEIFLDFNKDSISDLNQHHYKNIFHSQKLSLADIYFMNFIFCCFYERKEKINATNLMKIYQEKLEFNPLHFILEKNFHLYPTIEYICHFLAEIYPDKTPDLWKQYFSNTNTIFSNSFHTTDTFFNIIKEKKEKVLSLLIEQEKIQEKLQFENQYHIDIDSLLQTNLIKNRNEKYNLLILSFFEQKLITPVSLLTQNNVSQTLFEYAMTRPSIDNIWWLKHMLHHYSDFFELSQTISYFEDKMKRYNFLRNFQKEQDNYWELLNLMKKIQLYKELDSQILVHETEKNIIRKI